MNAKTKSWLMRAVGALVGLVGIAIFIAIVAPADSLSLRQQVLAAKVASLKEAQTQASPAAAATIPRSAGVVVLVAIAGAVALALLGWSWSRAGARRDDQKRAALRHSLRASHAPEKALSAPAHVADATASEFDDTKRPDFLPVPSLTEVKARRRGAQRQRQACRAAHNVA